MSDFNPIIENPKAYLDYISHEYKAIGYDKKLLHMALFLCRGGNLQTFINEYRSRREPYITRTIYDTLMMYLSYMRTGQPISGMNCILKRKLNENQLVDLLSAELRLRSSGTPNPHNMGTFSVDDYRAERYELGKYLDQRAEAWTKIIYGESLMGKINLFTETRERLAADNPWLQIAKEIENMEYENPTCAVHPEDKRIINGFNEKTTDDKYRLRLNLPPEPFQGNALDAKVAILMLNPGFVERCNVGEYNKLNDDQKKDFIKAKCATMSIQDELCVSEDDIINKIGEYYWKRKLKKVLEIPHANSKVAVISFLGYFSGKYKDIPKRLFENDEQLLHTQKYTIRLIRYLMEQQRIIIVSRNVKRWYTHIPELENYEKKVLLKSYLNPTISPNNCKDNGWELIVEALTEK